MPFVRSESPGNAVVASATLSFQRTYTIIAGATQLTTQLSIDGLPRQVFWINQTAGAIGATVIAQWSRNDRYVVPLMQPDWKPYAAPFVLVPGGLAPTRVVYEMTAKLCRLSITAPAGNAVTVDVLYGGFV